MRILATFVLAPIAPVEATAPAVVWALRLPSLTAEARRRGIADTVVIALLDEFRRRGLRADEAALVLREEIDAVSAGGCREDFGSAVAEQLSVGLRGRVLAGAVRAEHRARGIGHAGRENRWSEDALESHWGRS